jgi:hypothetical protein
LKSMGIGERLRALGVPSRSVSDSKLKKTGDEHKRR